MQGMKELSLVDQAKKLTYFNKFGFNIFSLIQNRYPFKPGSKGHEPVHAIVLIGRVRA